MDFQQAIQSGFSNYANFNGRAARSEFWYWQLFVTIGGLAGELLDLVVSYGVLDIGGSPLSILFWLATFIPNLAVMVRRLHDTDRGGWWLLLFFIPLIGPIVLIMMVHERHERLQPVRRRSAAGGRQPALKRPIASSLANR